MAKLGLPAILTIIAGIVMVIEGILNILNPSWAGVLGGVITIILGLVALASTGVIKQLGFIPFNKIFILILGIVALILASFVGGILLIIAAILLFMGK